MDPSRLPDLLIFLKKHYKKEKEGEKSQLHFAHQLKAIPQFDRIAKQEDNIWPLLKNWASKLTYKSCIRGEEIYSQGGYSDTFYLILSGVVGFASKVKQSENKSPQFYAKTAFASSEASPPQIKSLKLNKKKQIASLSTKFIHYQFKYEIVSELLDSKAYSKLQKALAESSILPNNSEEKTKQLIEHSISPVKKPKDKSQHPTHTQHKTAQKQQYNSDNNLLKNFSSTTPENEEKELTADEKLIIIKYPGSELTHQLKDTESFGEEALFSFSLRNESAVCLSPELHLAVLKRDDFKSFLQENADQLLTRKIQFIRSNHIFKDWTHSQIKHIYIESFESTCSKGEAIFNEGDRSSTVFIVKSGTFSARKEIVIDFGTQGTLLNSKQKKRVDTSLCTYSEGELFGEEDLLRGRDRTFSVVCDSIDGELLIIQAHEFLFRVVSQSLQQIISIQQQKIEFFQHLCEVKERSISQYSSYLIQNPIDSSSSSKQNIEMNNNKQQQNQFLLQKQENDQATQQQPFSQNLNSYSSVSIKKRQLRNNIRQRKQERMIQHLRSIDEEVALNQEKEGFSNRVSQMARSNKQILQDKILQGHPMITLLHEKSSDHYQQILSQIVTDAALANKSAQSPRILPSLVQKTLENCKIIEGYSTSIPLSERKPMPKLMIPGIFNQPSEASNSKETLVRQASSIQPKLKRSITLQERQLRKMNSFTSNDSSIKTIDQQIPGGQLAKVESKFVPWDWQNSIQLETLTEKELQQQQPLQSVPPRDPQIIEKLLSRKQKKQRGSSEGKLQNVYCLPFITSVGNIQKNDSSFIASPKIEFKENRFQERSVSNQERNSSSSIDVYYQQVSDRIFPFKIKEQNNSMEQFDRKEMSASKRKAKSNSGFNIRKAFWQSNIMYLNQAKNKMNNSLLEILDQHVSPVRNAGCEIKLICLEQKTSSCGVPYQNQLKYSDAQTQIQIIDNPDKLPISHFHFKQQAAATPWSQNSPKFF